MLFIFFSLLLIGAGIILAYEYNRDIPSSISALVHDLPKENQWMWSAWLATISILILPSLLEAVPEEVEFLGFLTEVCLLGTSVTPLVEKETRLGHYIFAISAGILSQACVAFICPSWLLVWLIMAMLLTATFAGFNSLDEKTPSLLEGKGVFIAEVLCALSLYGCLLFH